MGDDESYRKKLKYAQLGYDMSKYFDPKKVREMIKKHRDMAHYLEIGADKAFIEKVERKKSIAEATKNNNQETLKTLRMEEELIVDDTVKMGFNLGYRLAATAEGRKKAVELVKGKEDLPISKAIEAGVKQGMTDELKEGLEAIMNRTRSHGRSM